MLFSQKAKSSFRHIWHPHITLSNHMSGNYFYRSSFSSRHVCALWSGLVRFLHLEMEHFNVTLVRWRVIKDFWSCVVMAKTELSSAIFKSHCIRLTFFVRIASHQADGFNPIRRTGTKHFNQCVTKRYTPKSSIKRCKRWKFMSVEACGVADMWRPFRPLRLLDRIGSGVSHKPDKRGWCDGEANLVAVDVFWLII